MSGFRVLTFSLEYTVLRITNMHDWIIATAASRINRRICVVINTVNNVCLIDGPLFPSKVNSVLRLYLRLDVLPMLQVGLGF